LSSPSVSSGLGWVAGSGHLPGSRFQPGPRGHNAFVTTPRDPDLQHLADLLDFLPGPDDREFWLDIDHGRGIPLDGLAMSMEVLRDPAPHESAVVVLAQYLMALFESRGLAELLDDRLRYVDLPLSFGKSPRSLGNYWVRDLLDTCWRLCVCYNADGSWARKWPEGEHSR
jgi:hypothetical protein